MLGLSSVAGAQPEVVINMVPDIGSRIERIAVMPVADCPAGVDCLFFEKALQRHIWTYTDFLPLQSKTVRKVLFELDILEYDVEAHREILAKALDVSALALPLVTGVQTDDDFLEFLFAAGSANVGLRFVETASGETLLRGVATKASIFRQGEDMIGSLYKDILQKAFGKKHKRKKNMCCPLTGYQAPLLLQT